MGGIVGGPKQPSPPPAPPPPPPTPQIEEAREVAKRNQQDVQARRQGRRTTVLTGDAGLPDLGATTRTGT